MSSLTGTEFEESSVSYSMINALNATKQNYQNEYGYLNYSFIKTAQTQRTSYRFNKTRRNIHANFRKLSNQVTRHIKLLSKRQQYYENKRNILQMKINKLTKIKHKIKQSQIAYTTKEKFIQKIKQLITTKHQ